MYELFSAIFGRTGKLDRREKWLAIYAMTIGSPVLFAVLLIWGSIIVMDLVAKRRTWNAKH